MPDAVQPKLRVVLALILSLLALPASSAAQRTAAVAGGISGTVLDSESGAPLPGAVIVLEADATAALPAAGGAPFLTSARSTTSSAAGLYRFDQLPAGRYRLRISRLGYRAASIGVELRGTSDSRVSVALTVQPVPLEPLEIRGSAGDPFGRQQLAQAEIDGARVAVARARQRSYLASDVRELTHADVVESVTLGENDIFRAIQRAPGVAARDDYGADFWVRGASWDQTRVYFDGVPLFNPVHGFGLLSAINTDAVGGALLHPGVRSASLGEGAAAILEVTSRAGGGSGGARGLAELSLASGRLALDGRALDGRAAWMGAGRRSWLDLVTSATAEITGDPTLRLPYSFDDLTLRGDLQLSGDRALEASAITQTDRITGTIPDVYHRTRASWGNTGGRVSYLSSVAGYRSRLTLGASRYAARVRRGPPDPEGEQDYSAPMAAPSDNSLTHLSLAGELAPDAPSGSVLSWRAGYGVVYERGAYEGPEGYAFSHYPQLDADSALVERGSAARGVIWGERRWGGDGPLALETGLRVEGGRAVMNGGSIRIAPRITARYALSPDLSLSAGLGRAYQYSQSLSGVGPMIGPGYTASQLWLVADEDTPAIRADIASLGAELWVGGDWLLGASTFARRSTGVALPDPTPGELVDRPLFVSGENDARGLELSARRLAGRWTAAAAYSYGVSVMEASGLRFPAAEDRAHSLDLSSMVRLGRGLRVGSAYSYATGAPYTRVHSYLGCIDGPSSCTERRSIEEPNAERNGDYSSLDLLLDWTLRFRGWELGTYLQLRNALGHRNDVSYSDTYVQCPVLRDTPECPIPSRPIDHFQQGLPTIPVFGFRARF